MNFKDLALDFINYLFLLGLIIFFLLYIILGDRFAFFTEFFKSIVPLAFFGVPFLIIIKLRRESCKKYRKEDKLNEIILYLSKLDKLKDKIVIISAALLIIVIAIIDGDINTIDIAQAIIFFITIFFWRLILFRRKDELSGLSYITLFDKVKDEVVVFLMPIIIIAIALLGKEVNLVDFFQALVTFLIIFGWHMIMFRKAD